MRSEPKLSRLAVWNANQLHCHCALLCTAEVIYCELVWWVLL